MLGVGMDRGVGIPIDQRADVLAREFASGPSSQENRLFRILRHRWPVVKHLPDLLLAVGQCLGRKRLVRPSVIFHADIVRMQLNRLFQVGDPLVVLAESKMCDALQSDITGFLRLKLYRFVEERESLFILLPSECDLASFAEIRCLIRPSKDREKKQSENRSQHKRRNDSLLHDRSFSRVPDIVRVLEETSKSPQRVDSGPWLVDYAQGVADC